MATIELWVLSSRAGLELVADLPACLLRQVHGPRVPQGHRQSAQAPARDGAGPLGRRHRGATGHATQRRATAHHAADPRRRGQAVVGLQSTSRRSSAFRCSSTSASLSRASSTRPRVGQTCCGPRSLSPSHPVPTRCPTPRRSTPPPYSSTATRSWDYAAAFDAASAKPVVASRPISRRSSVNPERARRLVMIAADEAATPAEAGRVSEGARRAGWLDRRPGSRRRAAGALDRPRAGGLSADWALLDCRVGRPQPPSGSPSTAEWVALNRRLGRPQPPTEPPSTADWAVRLQIRRGDELQEMAARISQIDASPTMSGVRLARLRHLRICPEPQGQRSFHMVIWRRPTAPVGGWGRPSRRSGPTHSAVEDDPVGRPARPSRLRGGLRDDVDHAARHDDHLARLTVEQRDDLRRPMRPRVPSPRRRRPRR